MLTDRRLITFLAKSPVKSVATVADSLRHLDERWIPEELEYELFDNGPQGISGSVAPGMATNALLAFTWHAKRWSFIRRRAKQFLDPDTGESETIVFYELTPTGRQAVRALDALANALN